VFRAWAFGFRFSELIFARVSGLRRGRPSRMFSPRFLP
jgi:hypothetical protein